MKKLGLNIKAERSRKDLSQAKLSEKINISVNSISAIERGVQIPNAVTIYNIAKVLQASLDELFKDVE